MDAEEDVTPKRSVTIVARQDVCVLKLRRDHFRRVLADLSSTEVSLLDLQQ